MCQARELTCVNLFLEQCDQHYYSNETVESSCIDIFGKIYYIYTI